jgi:hypothetical protein
MSASRPARARVAVPTATKVELKEAHVMTHETPSLLTVAGTGSGKTLTAQPVASRGSFVVTADPSGGLSPMSAQRASERRP